MANLVRGLIFHAAQLPYKFPRTAEYALMCDFCAQIHIIHMQTLNVRNIQYQHSYTCDYFATKLRKNHKDSIFLLSLVRCVCVCFYQNFTHILPHRSSNLPEIHPVWMVIVCHRASFWLNNFRRFFFSFSLSSLCCFSSFGRQTQ